MVVPDVVKNPINPSNAFLAMVTFLQTNGGFTRVCPPPIFHVVVKVIAPPEPKPMLSETLTSTSSLYVVPAAGFVNEIYGFVETDELLKLLFLTLTFVKLNDVTKWMYGDLAPDTLLSNLQFSIVEAPNEVLVKQPVNLEILILSPGAGTNPGAL